MVHTKGIWDEAFCEKELRNGRGRKGEVGAVCFSMRWNWNCADVTVEVICYTDSPLYSSLYYAFETTVCAELEQEPLTFVLFSEKSKCEDVMKWCDPQVSCRRGRHCLSDVWCQEITSRGTRYMNQVRYMTLVNWNITVGRAYVTQLKTYIQYAWHQLCRLLNIHVLCDFSGFSPRRRMQGDGDAGHNFCFWLAWLHAWTMRAKTYFTKKKTSNAKWKH